MFRILIILLTISSNANAGFNIGTSLLYTDIKDPKYRYIDSYTPKINSFNIGYNKEFNGLNIGVSTNRLLTRDVKRKVKCNGQTCINLTQVKHDTLHLGYRVQRYIPNIFISNVAIKKSLYLNDDRLGIQRNNIIVYGIGGNYLFNKNVIFGVSVLMPNKEIYLKKGLGLSINYSF